MRPGIAIRKFCLTCCDGYEAVKDCQGDEMVDGPCPFFPFRKGKGRTSVKLIKQHCLYCQGLTKGSHLEPIENCLVLKCPLYKFRMGTNPNIIKKPTSYGKDEAKMASK